MKAVIGVLTLSALLACESAAPPGPPVTLRILAGDNQHGPVVSRLEQPLTVQLLDKDRRPVAGHPVTFVVTGGNGSVFTGSSVTNAQGVASDLWTLGDRVADAQRVEARAIDAASDHPAMVAVFSAIAEPGPVAHIYVPLNLKATVGTSVSSSLLSVNVTDAFSNPVPSVAVTFTATTGTLTQIKDTTDQLGQAAPGAWTLATFSGTQTVKVEIAGAEPVWIGVEATPGPAAQLKIVRQPPSQAVSGVEFSLPPQVTMADVYGNSLRADLAAGNGVSVQLESGSGTLSGIDSPPFIKTINGAGVATFTGLSLSGNPGPYTLRFISSLSGITPVVSSVINLTTSSAH